MALTEQKKRFADRYFETLKGSESAIYAGYSEKTAKQIAHNLLQEPEVEEYLSGLRTEYAEKSAVSKERWLKELARIGFSDIRNVLTVDGGLKSSSEWDDDTAAAIASVESFDEYCDGEKIGTNRKIKMYDKLNSLDKLGRHLGFFEKDNEQSRLKLPETINVIVHKPEDAD